MENRTPEPEPDAPQVVLPYAEYFDRPVEFARDVCGIEPWDGQIKILHAIGTRRKVAVRSGHKVGKSLADALVAVWWVSTRPRAKVVLTSSSFENVKEILWPEIRMLRRTALKPLGGEIHDTPKGGWNFTDGRRMFGVSTKKPENAAGKSGDQLLIVADEASGIEDIIFEALQGNLAGGASMLLTGNPTQAVGQFYRAFNEECDVWETIHISSLDSPNVVAGRVVVRGLAERSWAEERLHVCGEESDEYQVRVVGNFPSRGDNVAIGLKLTEQALERWQETKAEGRLEIGVDCAGFGDDENVAAGRRGKRMFPLVAVPGIIDAVETAKMVAGRVMEFVREHRPKGSSEPRARVKIDACGGYGNALALQLGAEEFKNEVEIVMVMVSETADDEEHFPNLRSQVWFGVADWLREGGGLPPGDRAMLTELRAARYSFDARTRRVIEPKREMKKRLKRSPDRADAVCLCVYSPPVVERQRATIIRRGPSL